MILHAEDWKRAVPQPLHRPVVQVHVRYFEIRRARNLSLISLHGEAMVLRRNEHMSAVELLHRMISTAVAVRELHRRTTEGETNQLVAKANPKHRDARFRDR